MTNAGCYTNLGYAQGRATCHYHSKCHVAHKTCVRTDSNNRSLFCNCHVLHKTCVHADLSDLSVQLQVPCVTHNMSSHRFKSSVTVIAMAVPYAHHLYRQIKVVHLRHGYCRVLHKSWACAEASTEPLPLQMPCVTHNWGTHRYMQSVPVLQLPCFKQDMGSHRFT